MQNKIKQRRIRTSCQKDPGWSHLYCNNRNRIGWGIGWLFTSVFTVGHNNDDACVAKIPYDEESSIAGFVGLADIIDTPRYIAYLKQI